jgi:hypothetical protein
MFFSALRPSDLKLMEIVFHGIDEQLAGETPVSQTSSESQVILKTMRKPLDFAHGQNELDFGFIDAFEAVSLDELRCPIRCFDAVQNEGHDVAKFRHDVVQTIDPYRAEILLSARTMSDVRENSHLLRFNCLGNVVPLISISSTSVPIVRVPLERPKRAKQKCSLILNIGLAPSAKSPMKPSFRRQHSGVC